MATQLNDWLSIDKASGTGNAQITLTASSYSELVDRVASLKIQAQTTNAILNVRQKAFNPNEEELKQKYFWVEFLEPNGEITWSQLRGKTDIQYSFDGTNWFAAEDWVSGFSILRMGSNTCAYFKNNTKVLYIEGYDNTIKYTLGLEMRFNSYAKIGGNMSSIVKMGKRCLYRFMSSNAFLIDASELILPWSRLSDSCYDYMFDGCTSLKTAPALPSTTLAYSCYSNMFDGCTSLINAPELPATTLADDCYYSMFLGCTSLKTAPILPAKTLKQECYERMFKGCTSLNYIKMLSTNISGNMYSFEWVKDVAPTGTFVKHPDANIPTGDNGIPSGWTVETATS